MRTLCYAIHSRDSGDVLLTTWNETPTTEGAVASVSVTGDVNSADIATSAVPEGYLAGYPAYYWFPSGRNFYATIQVNSRLNGRSNLINYFKGFLGKYSNCVIVDDETSSDEEDIIVGYSSTGAADAIENVHPSYRCRGIRLPGDLAYLKANRDLIRRLVRRDELNYSVQEDVSLWQSIWRNIVGEDTIDISGKQRVSMDIEFQPSVSEFNKIVANWSKEQDVEGSHSLYQDIGFRLQGDSKVRWLSSSVASDLIELDIIFSNKAVIDGESLLDALLNSRQEVLSLAERVKHEVA